MARIRTIKPDAFISESLSSVPRGTRWTFAGLWTYADDKGRARDDVRLVKAALYPLDDDTSLADVRHDLDLLEGIGAICRYAVADKKYLHMPKWEHQKINRPTPAKSPPCPIHEGVGSPHGEATDDSLTPHGVLSEPVTDLDTVGQSGTHGVLSESSTWEKEVEEEREQEREFSTAVAVRDDAEPTAQSFVAEWIEACEERPPSRVIGQVAKELKAMLSEGIAPDRVRNGLIEWNRRGLHPSTLASVVHEVSERRTKPNSRQAETDGIFERAAVRMGVIQGGQR